MRLAQSAFGLCVALAVSVTSAVTAQPRVDLALIDGTVITVDGRDTVAQAIAIGGGAIVAVGTSAEIKALAGAGARVIDLAGKSVMPTLISTHVHPGFQKGVTYVAANYTRDTVMNDLNRALYFGVSVVQSQGIERGDVLYRIRADQAAGTLGGAKVLVAGRGIGAPNAGPGAAAYAGIAYEITTEAEARRAVEELAANQVDIVKIWVDDRNGRAPRLSPALYGAVIDAAHATQSARQRARVLSHRRRGTGGGRHRWTGAPGSRRRDERRAHCRDRRAQDVRERQLVESAASHAGGHSGVADARRSHAAIADGVRRSGRDRQNRRRPFEERSPLAAADARERYAILERSLAKLSAAGANVVLGADTGIEDHLFGLAEHLELQAMVDAGMTPAQVLVAATSRAAAYLHLDDRGSLVPGKRADLLVLDASPLEDIVNARRISRMFINGVEIDRAALRAQITD